MIKETDIIIVGAGPVGLFTVFEAGLLGLDCILIDNLDKIGGQCSELYPEKPIYDIPGVPFQTAQEHIDALLEQIKPFNYEVYLNQRVDSLTSINHDGDEFWHLKTTENTEFLTKNVFIAAGAGSFEPRRPANINDPDKFLDKGVTYAVRNKDIYKDIYDIIVYIYIFAVVDTGMRGVVVSMCTHVYIYIYVCVHARARAHAHARTRTLRTHAHTHTHAARTHTTHTHAHAVPLGSRIYIYI